MQERILPYLGYAYEHDLIEYAGTVLPSPPENIDQYTSPGVTVYREDVGVFQILLNDKVPLWPHIMFGTPTAQDLSCIDEGFGSTVQCVVAFRDGGDPTKKYFIYNSEAYFPDPNGRQVGFKVHTFTDGTPDDLGFCFRILLSGQPAKYVLGTGA